MASLTKVWIIAPDTAGGWLSMINMLAAQIETSL